MTPQQSTILEDIETIRTGLRDSLQNQQGLRQYFTNARLARLMASMMDYKKDDIHILDPGAGVGILFAACIEQICTLEKKPSSVSVTAYEIDDSLCVYLKKAARMAKNACNSVGIDFSYDIKNQDYLECNDAQYSHIITNPPYGKINTNSDARQSLDSAGICAPNMYAAFVGLASKMLTPDGQMVFITPRSFCNGSYFYRFRRMVLESLCLQRIHHFNSRCSLFADDGVLQENVIVHATRDKKSGNVIISSSGDASDYVMQRTVKRSEVILPDDSEMFIHIVPDKLGADYSEKIRGLPCSLGGLDMDVSTGKVVDFRIRGELRFSDEENAVPLIRPFNISDGTMCFPEYNKKHCNFIMAGQKSQKLLVNNGNYVLVKRFTTTEQEKRITAAIWTSDKHPSDTVGFENRVNYFHSNGSGLNLSVAKGLWAFLNSTFVDAYFRQFNGNTQVNASDLRYIKYPSRRHLGMLGRYVKSQMSQNEIDDVVDRIAFDSGARR